mmetsp:Transcript_7005/g.22077  ORF Transcript_7005/g.22077 Transcript_7005/m.22077 type:complete len:406 (-) Transcript_7005:1303-2520(-)
MPKKVAAPPPTAEEYATLTARGDELLAARWAKEAKPLSDLYFVVISCKRPANVKPMEAKLQGCSPTWIVGAGDVEAYKAAGATNVVEGGGLCASRNLALQLAGAAGKPCVQISDDIKSLSFVASREDTEQWVKPGTIQVANQRAKQAEVGVASLGACARYIDVQTRRVGCKLGGTYPCGNPGQALGGPVVGAEHFVVGDFIVVQPDALRFDETMTLKEDYDFTCQHIYKHGRVARCNRLLILAEHYVNAGGAVAVRNKQREAQNIKHLRSKWPGVFLGSPRGPSEVRLIWAKRDVTIGGTRIFEPDPRNPGRGIYDQEEARRAREKRLSKAAGKPVHVAPAPPKAPRPKKAKVAAPPPPPPWVTCAPTRRASTSRRRRPPGNPIKRPRSADILTTGPRAPSRSAT